jgi:hypothetical protein
MSKLCLLALSMAFGITSAVASCSAVPADQRIGIDAPDGSEATFGVVGEYFATRCGSLDCHGQPGRNMRVWGCEGMRLDPHDVSGCFLPGQTPTTAAEHQATYRSVVGLEPAVMSTVVAGHGAHPELLTFVRKARGLEAHKGGTLITPGDDQDICITSWLAGKTNEMECAISVGYPVFPLDASVR